MHHRVEIEGKSPEAEKDIEGSRILVSRYDSMHKVYFLKKTYSIFVKKYILWLYLPISTSLIRVYAQKCKKPGKKIMRYSHTSGDSCDTLSRTLK